LAGWKPAPRGKGEGGEQAMKETLVRVGLLIVVILLAPVCIVVGIIAVIIHRTRLIIACIDQPMEELRWMENFAGKRVPEVQGAADVIMPEVSAVEMQAEIARLRHELVSARMAADGWKDLYDELCATGRTVVRPLRTATATDQGDRHGSDLRDR